MIHLNNDQLIALALIFVVSLAFFVFYQATPTDTPTVKIYPSIFGPDLPGCELNSSCLNGDYSNNGN